EDFSSALFPAGDQFASLVEGLRMVQDFGHRPVMVEEVVDLFSTVPAGVVVDATAGGGGHAAALLDAYPHLGILGLDRDPAALEAAGRRLAPFGRRAVLRHARFADLGDEVETARHDVGDGWPAAPDVVSGVLMDLGVSSPQLDRADRGFSYRNAGPLDMRMDPTGGPTAGELVNEADVAELAALFAANGEGRLAGRIARAVVAARPLSTTTELADVVAAAVPAAARR